MASRTHCLYSNRLHRRFHAVHGLLASRRGCFTSQNRGRLSEGRRHVGFQDEHVHGEEAVKTHRLTQKRGRRPRKGTSILAKLDPCLSECVHQRRFGEVSLCLSRVRAKSHSSRTTLALSSSRERRSRSSMLSSLSAGTFECGRPQIVFERGRCQVVI